MDKNPADLYLKSCMAIFNFKSYDLLLFPDIYISEFEMKLTSQNSKSSRRYKDQRKRGIKFSFVSDNCLVFLEKQSILFDRHQTRSKGFSLTLNANCQAFYSGKG